MSTGAGLRRVVGSSALVLLVVCPGTVLADPVEFTPEIVGVGLPVMRIELRTDVPSAQLENAAEVLYFEPGQILDHESVRRTLLAVHGSGLVSQAEVRTRLVDGGVELMLVAWSNVLVEQVEFVGTTSLGRQDLAEVVAVDEGRPLIESQVMRSVFDLQDRLTEDGYLEGSARVDVRVEEVRNTASVAFDVDPGPRSRVGSIEFTGDLGPFEPDRLRGAFSFEVGDRYWPQRVQRDRDTLQRYLIHHGYRTARVSRPVQRYDWDSHLMHLTYAVELGPLVELEVVGADLRTLRRAGVLPFLGPQGYDPALLSYSEARVRAWYQSQGHYDVRVDLVVASADNERIELQLSVDPGPVHTLRSLTFDGNEAFDEQVLGLRMQTRERRFLDPGSGRVVDDILAEDLRRLTSFYQLQGFHDVAVGPETVSAEGQDLALSVPVIEGERRVVGNVTWEGVSKLPVDRLVGAISIHPGGPYHRNLAEQAVNMVRSTYRNEGFDNVLASTTVEWDDRRRTVDVAFHVLEGPQTIVRRVVVRGQRQTSVSLLRRAIDVEPGDAVGRSRMLDIQRDLHRLGVFSDVDVDIAQGSLLTGERDLLVRLEEGDRHRVSLGGGYDTEDGFRGLFTYSLANLMGRAVSLNLDTVVGQREELYRLLLRQPPVGAMRFPLTYSIFQSREEETAYDKSFDGDFITIQTGAQIEAVLNTERLRAPLLFTFKDVDNNAPDEIDEILFDRERSKVRISSIAGAIQLDKRNSQINPTEGRNTVLQAEWAFEAFGTDENFLKLFAQQTHYWDFGVAGVVGASLRLGGIESFRAPVEKPDAFVGCQADPIPDFGVALSERFFGGGRSTHRAYKLDTLGILGETLFVNRDEIDGECVDRGLFPTGGNGMVLFNFDYRYPILGGFWATTFYDAGNIWADWRDISSSEIKGGAGVGLGWDSPIGPLRLEIGWKLDREEGEDPYQVFLSFGTAF